MLFKVIALVFTGALTVAANIDVGGPHGSYQPAKRQLHAGKKASRSFKPRRHRKRGTCKPKAESSTQQSASTSTIKSSKKAATTSAQVEAAAETYSAAETSSAQVAASSTAKSATKVVSSALSEITGFLGSPNSGIGSWFRTNNGGDDTNGRSWCQLNYEDDWLGFAPSVQTMLDNFGSDLEKAATAYCGLEATATNPDTGMTATIYIVDGFASEWVRTPDSVDLTLGAFKALYGSETSDKDIVIKNLQWTLTGNRKEEYSYNYGN